MIDTQGPEAGRTIGAPTEASAWLVVATRFYPPTDTDPTPQPPAGPDDDCDGDFRA